MRREVPYNGRLVEVTTAADYGTPAKVPAKKLRCSCHLAPEYDGCTRCPQCRHWSFDDRAGACERHQCGYAA